jgi:hypothetical protein
MTQSAVLPVTGRLDPDLGLGEEIAAIRLSVAAMRETLEGVT